MCDAVMEAKLGLEFPSGVQTAELQYHQGLVHFWNLEEAHMQFPISK